MVGNFLRGIGTGILAQSVANDQFDKEQTAKYAQMIQEQSLKMQAKIVTDKAKIKEQAVMEQEKYKGLLGSDGTAPKSFEEWIARGGTPTSYNQYMQGQKASYESGKLQRETALNDQFMQQIPGYQSTTPAPTIPTPSPRGSIDDATAAQYAAFDGPNAIDLSSGDAPQPVTIGQPTSVPPLPSTDTSNNPVAQRDAMRAKRDQLLTQAAAAGDLPAAKALTQEADNLTQQLTQMGEPTAKDLEYSRKKDTDVIEALRNNIQINQRAFESADRALTYAKQAGYTGPGAGFVDILDKVAGIAGAGDIIPGDPAAREGLKVEEVDQILKRVAETKGAITDYENNLFGSTAASIYRTPEGNILLATTAKYTAKRAQQYLDFMESYRKSHGSLDGAAQMWNAFSTHNALIKSGTKINSSADVGKALDNLNPEAMNTPVPSEEAISLLRSNPKQYEKHFVEKYGVDAYSYLK